MPRHTTSNAESDNLLFDAIHALRNELAELRDAIDELREEIGWGNRNRDDYNPALFQFRPTGDGLADRRELPPAAPPCGKIEEKPDSIPRRQESLW